MHSAKLVLYETSVFSHTEIAVNFIDKDISKTMSKQVLKRESQIVSLPNPEHTATNKGEHNILNTETLDLLKFTMNK